MPVSTTSSWSDLDGRTLTCPQPLAKVVEYGTQIADAVDSVHRQGMIHRDLKPGNIIVTAHGVKVLDFGIAKVTGQQDTVTLTGAAIGTPGYMAPEQWRGEADHRTDIFALGCVIYEMAIRPEAERHAARAGAARLGRPRMPGDRSRTSDGSRRGMSAVCWQQPPNPRLLPRGREPAGSGQPRRSGFCFLDCWPHGDSCRFRRARCFSFRSRRRLTRSSSSPGTPRAVWRSHPTVPISRSSRSPAAVRCCSSGDSILPKLTRLPARRAPRLRSGLRTRGGSRSTRRTVS